MTPPPVVRTEAGPVVLVGGTRYAARRVSAASGELRALELTSPAGRSYRLGQTYGGGWGCECPGHLYRRRCKHADACHRQGSATNP